MPPGEERSQDELTEHCRSPESSTTTVVILGPGGELEKGRKVPRKGEMCMASSGNMVRPLNTAMALGVLFLLLPTL